MTAFPGKSIACSLAIIFSLSACDFSCRKKTAVPPPQFDAETAFEKILQYEKFGPKVPGTPEHRTTGDWIVWELKMNGLVVREQISEAVTFDKKKIPVRNIIGSFRPELSKRVLLSAHWDTRPFADRDSRDPKKPILGVNDGGSGVVVLLGIAKALSENPRAKEFNTGVDFAFWDAEDWGIPSLPESYCLGSQYWAKNPVPENYRAEYGINFDMVGRIGSVFPVERYSYEKGRTIIEKMRESAKKTGNQEFFSDAQIGPIVDDHYYVSEALGFPVIDLIYMTAEGKFAPEWHTHSDTSEFISRDVLRAVGQTTLQLLHDGDQE